MAEQLQLKRVLGAMIFAARQPLNAGAMRKALAEIAQTEGGEASAFRAVKEADIQAALAELGVECERAGCGFYLSESAEGFRFQSDPACGVWVRHLLDVGKPNRLSRPAVETLAIIAYRQPITRAEIESIRGVTVDHVLHLLMEMQLIKIAGRSELPGRPMLYGTTAAFLEHFGMKQLRDLPGIEELARTEAARQAKPAAAAPDGGADATVAEAPAAEPAADAAPAPASEPAPDGGSAAP